MKNWIMNFIADERGSETTECSITGVLVAGGAVAGYKNLKSTLSSKQDEVLDQLADVTAE